MPAITIIDLTNAKLDVDHIAAVATSPANTTTDRLGNTKKTMAGAIGTIAAITNRGAWVTATAYAVKDLVLESGTWYICVVGHMSSAAFATDTASKWRVYQGVIADDLAAEDGVLLVGNAVDKRNLAAEDGVLLVGNAVDKRNLAAEDGAALVGTATGESLDKRLRSPTLATFEDSGAGVAPARELRWSDHYPGTTPPNVQMIGTSTAVVDSNGNLSVVADWASARGVLLDQQFTEGFLRIKMKRGPFMMAFHTQADGTHYGIWSPSGTTIEMGYFSAIGTLLPPTTLPAVAVPGAMGDSITIQFSTGAVSASAGAKLEVWLTNSGFGTCNTVTGGYVGVAGLNSGFVVLQSFGATPAVYESIKFIDGTGTDSIPLSAIGVSTKVSFIGHWFARMEAGALVAATTRQGSAFRFKCTGAAKVSLQLAISSAQTKACILSMYVDGTFKQHVTIGADGANGGGAGGSLGVYDIVTDLNQNVLSHVEVRVRGIHEADDKWTRGCGVMLRNVYAYNGLISPWPDARPYALFIGDSTVEGIACIDTGMGSVPAASCGDRVWGILAAESLGWSPIINGFGGTGLTTAGSGAMPATFDNTFNYMAGRPVDCARESVPYIVIEVGTNDSDASYQQKYIDLMVALIERYNPVRIYAVLPFTSTVHAAGIQAAIAAVGGNAAKFVNTDGWLVGTSDLLGAHPTEAGHAKAAALLAAFIKLDLLTYSEPYTG